jgi:hypothetical protein
MSVGRTLSSLPSSPLVYWQKDEKKRNRKNTNMVLNTEMHIFFNFQDMPRFKPENMEDI